MTDKKNDDPLLAQFKESLDQQANQLDAATLSQLRQARARALDELERKQTRFKLRAIWAGGFATATALLITLLLIWPGDNSISSDMAHDLADIDLLIDDGSIELYEDLDFYIWLEQQEQNANEA